MFGAPKIIRNLSIAGKRKKTKKLGYDVFKPEEVNLSENMNNLGLDRDGLIILCMLIGTDFNVGGIKGIGPKKSLPLVKKYKDDYDTLFKEVKWDEFFDYPWTDVFYLIKNMKTTDDYNLEWQKPDVDKIKQILIERHDFSEERIKGTMDKLVVNRFEQKGLNEFF